MLTHTQVFICLLGYVVPIKAPLASAMAVSLWLEVVLWKLLALLDMHNFVQFPT